MIEMQQFPLEDTRTPNNACEWCARSTVAGIEYEARSRHGASTALARVLVDAGIGDQPVQVYDKGRKTLRWPSLHHMATRTYSEGNQPLRQVRWQPYPT